MGLSYLKEKNWIDVTREERLYCTFLYWQIKDDEKAFIKWLNKKMKTETYDLSEDWEIGYEVCFYRDYNKLFNMSIRNSKFSSRRTFDLCLFSEKAIIIIEAKVQQAFKKKQILNLIEDQLQIKRLLDKNDINVDIIALCSSEYSKSQNSILKKYQKLKVISWQELFELYKNPIFHQADNLYKN